MSILHAIHQIWLGPNQRPTDLMDDWQMDGWNYGLWDETGVEEDPYSRWR